MRRLYIYSLLVSALLLLVFSQCRKSVNYHRPLTATVTPDSREFFGCRINGKPYSPASVSQASIGQCVYKQVYTGDSGWVFKLSGDRQESACRFFSVGIILDGVVLKNGERYKLGSPGAKKNYGSYFIVTECSQSRLELFTSDNAPGEVEITKVDKVKGIITGTFDFKVKDNLGNIHRISDGIFDRHYSN